MKLRKNNCYVITGGPGVGKTTLLNELVKYNFKIVPENAREIIKNEIEKNGEGLPWKNKAYYTSLMLKAASESYNAAPINDNIYFFDRGILDTLCYADMIGLGISDEMDHLAKKSLYNKKVFILPPWQEIYQTDSERKQSWEEAILTYEKMKETYLNYGYNLIEVPRYEVHNRAGFIFENIKTGFVSTEKIIEKNWR